MLAKSCTLQQTYFDCVHSNQITVTAEKQVGRGSFREHKAQITNTVQKKDTNNPRETVEEKGKEEDRCLEWQGEKKEEEKRVGMGLEDENQTN